jgi:uncharacterized protein YndB with AHSA1/START domain
MTTHESSGAVTVVRGVSATQRQVFEAWTEPALMQRWVADVATVDPRVGGSFRQETRAADGQRVVSGEYCDFLPDRRLLMTWRHQGPLDARAEREPAVTVDLVERGPDKTEVYASSSMTIRGIVQALRGR